MESALYNNIEQLENGTPEDKLIVLKSVYKIKNGKFIIQPVKNKMSGNFLGIPRLSEMDKQGLSYFATEDSKITIVDGMEFNLNDEVDRVNWEWVKHSPYIADSFEEAQMSPMASFYVYLEEREAKTSVIETNKLYKALQYVMEDLPIEYASRTRLLGVDMSGDSLLATQEFLLRIAREAPQKIIDIYESKDLNLKLLFFKAKDKEVIKFDGRVYRFGNQVIGLNEESALMFLSSPSNREITKLVQEMVEGNEYFDEDEIVPLEAVDASGVNSLYDEEPETPVTKAKPVTAKKTTTTKNKTTKAKK